MNTRSLIAGALGIAAVAGGVLYMVGAERGDDRDVAPEERGLPITARDAGPPPAPPATSELTSDTEGIVTYADPAPFFHRAPDYELVCNGVRGTVDADGVGRTGESCYHVDRNPSPYASYSNEALLADIEAGQPWAPAMMEELGTRYMAHGYVHTGFGWLKEAASRTGKVGLLHLAGLEYIHGDVEEEVLRYELIGILLARGYPAYEPKMLANQRTSLINAGVDTARLDALDTQVAEFVAAMPAMATDDVGDGGAS